jgi:hypothetical protein
MLYVRERWTPPLRAIDVGGRCRLWLGAYVHGDGHTLQEAADDLLARLRRIARGHRAGSFGASPIGPPDVQWLEFAYEIAALAEAGGDLRARVFGCSPLTP